MSDCLTKRPVGNRFQPSRNVKTMGFSRPERRMLGAGFDGVAALAFVPR
ncbi:hypothetical protein [Octadecabacter arcticus]|nr:hypothetical protein [Octadecabacter arcticus]